jgi:hypothetical protein
MSEGAVGLRHFVRVVAFLDRVPLAGGGVAQLVRRALRHRHAAAVIGVWTIQRIASETWREACTSIGTW